VAAGRRARPRNTCGESAAATRRWRSRGGLIRVEAIRVEAIRFEASQVGAIRVEAIWVEAIQVGAIEVEQTPGAPTQVALR